MGTTTSSTSLTTGLASIAIPPNPQNPQRVCRFPKQAKKLLKKVKKIRKQIRSSRGGDRRTTTSPTTTTRRPGGKGKGDDELPRAVTENAVDEQPWGSLRKVSAVTLQTSVRKRTVVTTDSQEFSRNAPMSQGGNRLLDVTLKLKEEGEGDLPGKPPIKCQCGWMCSECRHI